MANVKVAVRVRPLSRREVESGAEVIVNINGDTTSITNLKVPENSEADSRERIRHFVFDFCYWSAVPTDAHYVTQEMIFNELGTQVLESVLDGYNACILAYGQSGSGKTYTMMGMADEMGLIPRICENLFTKVSEKSRKKVTFRIDVSFLEIYNERVCDLLQNPFPHKNRANLKVREHPKLGTYVQDLSKHDVPDFQTVLSLIERGNQNRSVASTDSHSRSSRSHAIFTINFTQACLDAEMPSEIVSKIHLVDLAGSERASIIFNRTRLKEGSNINKSLVTLGNVISALAEKSLSTWSLDSLGSTYSLESIGSSPASSPRRMRQPFVPYRDSVLTWLLKDSLGGNSKTIMIATISPASTCYSETVGTLHYAQRAKCIVNKPVINEDPYVKLIRDLRAEIARLRELLASAQTHNVIRSPRDEVSIAEILNQNERKAFTLTKSWMEKWTESVVGDSEMSILKSTSSVFVDSPLPHLIVLDNHILSTGIKIYYLKHGKTLIGNDSSGCADIGVTGSAVLPEHCELDFDGTNVVLTPLPGAACFINEYIVQFPTLLRQADILKLGTDLTLRFNHPSQVQKLKEGKNELSVIHTPFPLQFFCNSEPPPELGKWCCQKRFFKSCNGTSNTHCPFHVCSFSSCQHKFCEVCRAASSCDNDKLNDDIHHLDSSNATFSCSLKKDVLCNGRHKDSRCGNGKPLENSSRSNSALSENNCKNSEALSGDRIQVPHILQLDKKEVRRGMSSDMRFISECDGANCSTFTLPSASLACCCHACYFDQCSVDKHCVFSMGANTNITMWPSPKNSTSTRDSKLFMDNSVCCSHFVARKLCQENLVAKNSIGISERCSPVGDSGSENEESSFQGLKTSVDESVQNFVENIHRISVKEYKEPLNGVRLLQKCVGMGNPFNVSSFRSDEKKIKAQRFQCSCWKIRRRVAGNCSKRISSAKILREAIVGSGVKKTSANGRLMLKTKLRKMFTRRKLLNNGDCFLREYRTKNKVSNLNKVVNSARRKPETELILVPGEKASIKDESITQVTEINPSSQHIFNSELLNNVQQFVNFVKDITDSKQLVKVLANSTESEKDLERNTEKKSIPEKEIGKEIPSIEVAEQRNSSQITTNVFTPVIKIANLLLATPNEESELKRSLSNTDIQQSLQLLEENENGQELIEQCPIYTQQTKVRTNSWSEPSQVSLDQLDNEIKDLQESLKEDLVNEVLDNINEVVFLYDKLPEDDSIQEEKTFCNKKLVRQSAKLCSSLDLIEDLESEPTQVQKRPLRMIGGIMSRSISLEDDEVECNIRCRTEMEKFSTSVEEMEEVSSDVETDPGVNWDNKVFKKAPPLIFITQPSDSFSESGIVIDENLGQEEERDNNADVVDDEEGSWRFDDNRSVEFQYSDDFESDESNDEESRNEDNGEESDEDIFYIPIDQLRGFLEPLIAEDKELVFGSNKLTQKNLEKVIDYNLSQSCQVRHEGSDQLEIESKEFTASNIQANADGDSLRFVGHHSNKELSANSRTKDKVESNADLMDEDIKPLIDFSTPCDLMNDEDDVFADSDCTVTPMDILIDYRMMTPSDRHRLYTIPELSSEYSSTPTEGILGSVSEAEGVCLEDEENVGKKESTDWNDRNASTDHIPRCSSDEEFSNTSKDDESAKKCARDVISHDADDETKCHLECGNKKCTSPIVEANELNENHRFQPQFDSSVVNPGIGLDSKRGLGADSGDESSSCKKTGHLLIMQSDSIGSSNNTLEGETGVDVATVQAPAACRELWKLYKQFSEDSEDESTGGHEVKGEMKNEDQSLTNAQSEEKGEQTGNYHLDGKKRSGIWEFMNEVKSPNNSIQGDMTPRKDHNNCVTHSAPVKIYDYKVDRETDCDKIQPCVNKQNGLHVCEMLENVNKIVETNDINDTCLAAENCVDSTVGVAFKNVEMLNGFHSLDDICVNGKYISNMNSRCAQWSSESSQREMNNVENDLTSEISKDAYAGLSNHLTNHKRDREIEIVTPELKAQGEVATLDCGGSQEKNMLLEEGISLSQKVATFQLSDVTWMKTSQWVNPVKISEPLPPITNPEIIIKDVFNDAKEEIEGNSQEKDVNGSGLVRESSMTPDSLEDVTPTYNFMTSWKLGQATPSTPTSLVVRNKQSPLAVPRSLYYRNTDFGAFNDLWGASTDSITFVFLGPGSNFGQEGLFARNLRSPRSPGRCHALSNSWRLKHGSSLLPRSISLDCIFGLHGMVPHSLSTRAASMESMIPEDLMGVVEKGRLHDIDMEEMKGGQTQSEMCQDSTPYCRALKHYSHSKNNSFLLPSRAFSQGSVIETAVSSKKSLAFERKTKKSVSWSDLSGQELTMEEGSMTKQNQKTRAIKPIIKRVESSNFVHNDYASSSCEYTETDAEEDLKKSALFTKIQKKRNPSAWVIAPQAQSFALKLPEHVKARIKQTPKSEEKEKVEEKSVVKDFNLNIQEDKSSTNLTCQTPYCDGGFKPFPTVDTSSDSLEKLETVIHEQKPPLAQMVEKLLANKEIIEEVQRLDNVNQLNNNMKSANFIVSSSDCDWARLSVILSEASVFFQQLSTFCAARTKIVAQNPDRNALVSTSNFKSRDNETQTIDTKNRMDSATITDASLFSPKDSSVTKCSSLPLLPMSDKIENVLQTKDEVINEAYSKGTFDSKVDSAVQVDTLPTTTRWSEGYKFRSKRRREACLKKELEILTQEKGRVVKALDRYNQDGLMRDDEDESSTEDELWPPDNPQYLLTYQTRLEAACNRVINKLAKIQSKNEAEMNICSSTSSSIASSLSCSTEYLPMATQQNFDPINRFASYPRNGLKKQLLQKQSLSSSSSLSLSSNKSSSDYLRPQKYCSQLVNIRRDIVAASRNPLPSSNKTLYNTDVLRRSSTTNMKSDGNTAKDIENLLWECQAARHRAQHEIELAQEQLKCQKMAVQNLASVLQQKA